MKIILKWIVGIIFLLAGVSGAIQKEYEALFLIPLALFIIPLSYKTLIEEKANLKLTSKTKWIIVIVGFSLFGFATKMKEFSKNKDENLTENESTNNDAGRNAEIDQTNFYIENDKFIDNQGISHYTSIRDKIIDKKVLYESEKTTDSDGDEIQVFAYKVIYELSLIDNGVSVNTYDFNGYLFESMTFRKFTNYGRNSDDICSKTLAYIPELNGKDVLFVGNDFQTYFYGDKKSMISEFTGINCGRGEPINGIVIQQTIQALKSAKLIDN